MPTAVCGGRSCCHLGVFHRWDDQGVAVPWSDLLVELGGHWPMLHTGRYLTVSIVPSRPGDDPWASPIPSEGRYEVVTLLTGRREGKSC